MLALTRSTRAAHIFSRHARALSAIAHSASFPNTDAGQSSNDPMPDEPTTMRQRKQWLAKSSAECMIVFPWGGIHSSAEGLAIARAVQDKYGPAKEVVFTRDVDCVNIFQPYFWLIFDDPVALNHLPEENAQITLPVADLPWSDGNVGLEEMMRGLGLPTTDAHHGALHPRPPKTETEPSGNTNDAPPEGYRMLDVRVDRAHHGPREVLWRKRSIFASHQNEDQLPEFAKAWLAFDGFSPESARGPHTPNLFRAREKWLQLAPASARENDDNAITEAVAVSPPSQEAGVEEVEAGPESSSETQMNEIPSREWVPIVPSMLHSQQRPKPASSPSKNFRYEDVFKTSNFIKPAAAEAATNTTDATSMPASAEDTTSKPLVDAAKLSRRRERILNLARQNARTPLPKLTEKPQPPPPTEAEKLDEEESERQGKERTIRERLWRLVGGNY